GPDFSELKKTSRGRESKTPPELRCEDGMLAALPLVFCPKRPVRKRLYTGRAMGEWYWIGLCTGLGVSGGLLGAALLGWTRVGGAGAGAFGPSGRVAIDAGLENCEE